ncbi:hypothetical protein C8R45DRAFT_928546 [Mycena sanguinolenta]|nr:hypothetical protein C8R45DRAFT_928546 [Mycena sanguinolenta]
MAIRERKRVFLACIACRRRKIRCISDEDNNPCTRCVKKGILCEYLSIDEERERSERMAALDNASGYSFSRPVWDAPHPPDSNIAQNGNSTQAGNVNYVSPLTPTTSTATGMAPEYTHYQGDIEILSEYGSHSVAPQVYNRDDLGPTLPDSQYADFSQQNMSFAYATTPPRWGTVLSISAFSLIPKAPQIRHAHNICGVESIESYLWND